jgi:pimeloyl-ACP methyl ester carboxylesterase
VGLLAVPLALLVVAAAAYVGASPSGWGYAVGFALVAVGLLSRPWGQRRGLTRVGLGLLLGVAVLRGVFATGNGLETVRLPDGGHRWVNRLVAERDGTMLAAHALVLTSGLPRSDAREFITALEAAFDRLDAAEGALATPAVATYLGLQSPKSFDTVVIPPPGGARSEVAVVFLHGFAGNFAVYCWQMAQAARAISALTVCPSVGPEGDWWTPRGERTLKVTLDWLAEQGIRRVYLGGLSNGGAGASVLVHRISHPRITLRGLVLVSGAFSEGATPKVPTLLVQGRHDSMMPTRSMRDIAERMGSRATWFEVDSGHFAFLDRHVECERAISEWLRQRERE